MGFRTDRWVNTARCTPGRAPVLRTITAGLARIAAQSSRPDAVHRPIRTLTNLWREEHANTCNSASDPIVHLRRFVGMLLPHCPYIAPKALYDYYATRVDVPIAGDQPETIKRFRRDRGILNPALPLQRIRVARTAYYGMCEYLDTLIGRILQCLDETGLSQNTLVVYMTDHGEMAGDHHCWWKSTYYEGSVGSPLIARLPGAIPTGAVCDAVCNHMDLGPTFAEIAGADFPDVDGRSLWSTLRGRHPPRWLDETTSEFCDGVGRHYYPARMVRSGPWKLWYYGDSAKLPPALFQLEDDPREQHDLGLSPKHRSIREQLVERVLADWNPAAAQREALRSAP